MNSQPFFKKSIHFFGSCLLLCLFTACSSTTESSTNLNHETSIENRSIDTAEVVLQSDTPIKSKDSIYCFMDYAGTQKFGFKNKEGVVIIEPKFDFAGDFYGDFGPVVLGNKHGFCDTSGKIIFSLDKVKFFSHHNELSGEPFLFGNNEGYFMVRDKKEKFGFVNNHGELQINCQFQSVQPFYDGMAAFIENDLMGYINTKGNKIITPIYSHAYSFSEGIAAVRFEDDKVGYINKQGELIIKPLFYYGYAFNEGLAAVSKTVEYGNFFYINASGETVIAGPFDEADNFKNGEALVFKRGKCRIIDKTGKQLRTVGTDCFQGC